MKKENNEKKSAPTAKKSKQGSAKIGRLLFRGSIYALFFFFVLVASTGIVLEYFFPAEEVRAIAERTLSKKLKLPLRIQKISFSLLSGMQVDGVTLGKQPLARIKKVVLDYDLSRLFAGKLVINQVLIDHPQLTAVAKNGMWNFQPLLDLLDKPSQGKPTAAFPLAQIDIKEVTLRQASARLDQDGKLSAHIDGLNLKAQGKASRNAIDLKLKISLTPDTKKPNISFQSAEGMTFESRVFTDLDFSAQDLKRLFISGTFALKNNRLGLSPLPSPDVAVEIDTEISSEVLTLKKLAVSLGKNNHINVSGGATNFSKDLGFNLMINEASLQLADLLVWGQQWLPKISGRGLLKAQAVKISGQLPGFVLKNLHIDGGTLSTKNLWLHHPEQNARLEDMNAELQLQEIALHDSQLGKAVLNINMQLKKGVLQQAHVTGWNQSLHLIAKGMNEISWQFDSDIKSVHYDHPQAKEIFLPLHAQGSGHLKKSNLTDLKLSYHLGTKNLASGAITGNMKNFGKGSLQLEQSFNINIAEAVKLLPKKFTEGLQKNINGTVLAQTSLTGKLNEKFFPVELKGQANFQLQKLTLNLKQPDLNITDLNSQVSFPLEFHADKGVRISQLDFHADIHNAKAFNTWQVKALKLDTEIKAPAFYNLQAKFGTLPMQTTTRIALENLDHPMLSLVRLKTDITLKTDLLPDDVRNTRASGNLSFKNLSAMKMLKTGAGSSRFNLDMHDKSLTRVRLAQKTTIHKPSFHQDEMTVALESVSLETVSRQNLKEGEVNIDTFVLQSPNLVTAQVKAALKKWGKTFAVEGQIGKLQLASLWDHLPESLRKISGLKNPKGSLDVSIKAKGNLPDDMNAMQPFELLAQANDKAEISAKIQLHNGSLNFDNIVAKNLSTKTRLTFKKGHANLSGNFIGKLDGVGKGLLEPKFEFNYVLDNLNILKVKQHQLKLKRLGVEHSLTGQIKGLKPFITGQRPIRASELLNRLDIELATALNQTSRGNSLLGKLKAQGKIATKIKLQQSAGKILRLDGSVEFDKFSLSPGLTNLTGAFLFSKSLLLAPKQQQSARFFPAQKKFFTPLRDFSRYKNIIRVESLKIAEHTLSDIGLDVVFKDNRLRVEKFIFDVLGGTVAGNLFLTLGQQGPVLKFSTEFAGVNTAKLLTIPAKKKVDAKIDGNLQIALEIKTGTKDQPVALDQLSVKIAITRIGAQTLDRLLLFLDPQESKPAIMDTRAKLKLATPHRVQVTLENGNLNVEAWLKSDLLGIFKAPELKRVPVAVLKRFNTIDEHLQALKGLQQISNYLSAREVRFEGAKMILQD